MPRRPHRKSRNGCIECKRRHIKCDETRPICSNCISSDRSCQYVTDGDADEVRVGRPPRRSLASHDSASSRTTSQNAPEELENRNPPVNMQHVGLFYHLWTETMNSFFGDFDHVQISFSEIMKEFVSAPYLMNELLALSAIHLSTLHPGEQESYRRQAIELQTHALSLFNQLNPEINAETCVPMFLFSSFLGLHEMCETFAFQETDFDAFLDRFVRYISLHQGVRAISRGTWDILSGSILGPILKHGEATTRMEQAPGNTCSRLLGLLKAVDLSQESVASCEQAILALQMVLTSARSNAQGRPSIQAISAWPVILCQGYTDLLRQKEPHALAILAHYGALVHSRRDMWMCGNGGRFLVELISQYLGHEWADWLIWPIHALADPESAIATD